MEGSSNKPLIKEEPKDLADQLGDVHVNLLPRKQLIITMMVMSFNLFTAFVDQTAITVVLSQIGKDLDSEKTINWAGTASLLANCVFQVLFGRLADIFGRKIMLLGSLVVLGLADLSCGLAQTGIQFYIFRAFAGIGTGGIQALTVIIVSDIVTLKQRGKYQGIVGANIGLGSAVGPFLMSAFSQSRSWRDFYFMMPGLLFFQIILTYIFVEDKSKNLDSILSKTDKFRNIDYWGIFFGTAALTLILIPINGGGSTYSWNSPLVISMFVVGAVCLVTFLFIEWKVPKLPMIPLKLFKLFSLDLILASTFFYSIVYYSFQYFIPYYFQIVKGYTEMYSAILLLNLVLIQAVGSTVAGQIISRSGHYKYIIVSGYALWLLSCGLLLMFDVDTKPGVISVVLLIMGSGIGWTFNPSMIAAQAQSRKADRAVVISTRNVLRSLGGAVGIAVASLIISNSLLTQIVEAISKPDNYNNIPIEYLTYMRTHIYNKVDITGLNDAQVATVRKMYMKAIRNYFYLTIPLMAFCVIFNLFVRDKGLQCRDETPLEKKEPTASKEQV